jgi:hypothetical protein
LHLLQIRVSHKRIQAIFETGKTKPVQGLRILPDSPAFPRMSIRNRLLVSLDLRHQTNIQPKTTIMKTLTRLLKEIFLLQRFQIHAIMILLLFSLSSCFQKFYKTNTVATTDSATLNKLVTENKSFILHTPDGAFAVTNPAVDADVFSGDKTALNPEYDKYLNPIPNDPNRLNMKKSGEVLNEVHLYTNNLFTGTGKINLGINQIYRVDVYQFDKKVTRNSRTLGIIGITVGSGVVVAVLATAATSFENGLSNIALNIH